MALAFSFSPSFPALAPILRPRRQDVLRCSAPRQTSSGGDKGSRSENALLKVAWYGSEFLGIAVSFFRPARSIEELPVSTNVLEKIDRTQVVEAIKQDFQHSYFVTGSFCSPPFLLSFASCLQLYELRIESFNISMNCLILVVNDTACLY